MDRQSRDTRGPNDPRDPRDVRRPGDPRDPRDAARPGEGDRKTMRWLAASLIFLFLAGVLTYTLITIRSNDLRHIQRQLHEIQQSHEIFDQRERCKLLSILFTGDPITPYAKEVVKQARQLSHTLHCPGV